MNTNQLLELGEGLKITRLGNYMELQLMTGDILIYSYATLIGTLSLEDSELWIGDEIVSHATSQHIELLLKRLGGKQA